MRCPACQEVLSDKPALTTESVKVVVQECGNCGGHFLPPLVANFFSLKVAQELESVKPTHQIPIATKPTCPYCHQTLSGITDAFSKKGVEIFVCPNNHGHFFPAGQLQLFLKAKKQKVDYKELWGIPTKSIIAVMLPIAILFTSVAVTPLALTQVGLIQDTRILAGDIISKPLITPVNANKVIVTFRTKSPSITTLNLTAPDGNYSITGESTPQLEHLYTLDSLTPSTNYTFTVSTNNLSSQPHSFRTQE